MQTWLMRLRRSAFAFPLALLAAALMLVISEAGYHQAEDELTTLVGRGQARLQLSRLVRRVTDAESGQLGYLVTGHADYLSPYRAAHADAIDSLTQLQRLLGEHGSAAGKAELAGLERAVRTKFAQMDQVLSLYQVDRLDSARALMDSGLGRDAMDAIRVASDKLLARQNAAVSIGLGQVFNTLMLNRMGVATLTVLSLLVMGLYLRQQRQIDRDREAQQALLRAERDRLEDQVQNRTHELTELASHLETAREDERARLARDLHDELGALLTSAKLDVARMRPRLAQAAPDLMPRMAHLVEALSSGIALKRRIIENLRPSSLSNLGLLPALEILCREFGERLGLPIETRFSPVTLTPACELTVFRLVQESLNNIAKHAQAHQVQVSLAQDGGEVAVSVSDDGVGFDPQAVGHARHGLVGMRYRVQAEGGRLRVTSQPGRGTGLRAWLPASAPASTQASDPAVEPTTAPTSALASVSATTPAD